jgi:hypothetical protein
VPFVDIDLHNIMPTASILFVAYILAQLLIPSLFIDPLLLTKNVSSISLASMDDDSASACVSTDYIQSRQTNESIMSMNSFKIELENLSITKRIYFYLVNKDMQRLKV